MLRISINERRHSSMTSFGNGVSKDALNGKAKPLDGDCNGLEERETLLKQVQIVMKIFFEQTLEFMTKQN